MASPTVAATNTSTDGGTSQTVDLPSGIVSGNGLLVLVTNNGSATVSTPAGWNLLGTGLAFSSLARLTVFYRQADGTEGSTLSITVSADEKGTHQAYRITGQEAFGTQAPEIDISSTGTDVNPDPASLTPTGGSKDYLFIAAHGCDTAQSTSGFPTNYSNGLSVTASGGSECNSGSAERELTAASDDPGTFTISSGKKWVAATIAVHPADVSAPDGAGLQTLAALVGAGIGHMHPDGAGIQLLPALTQLAAGHMHPDGAGLQLLAAITQVGAGEAGAPDGAGIQLLPALTQLAAGHMHPDGAGLQTLAAIIQAAVGVQSMVGAGIQTLPALLQAGVGHMHPDGAGLQLLAAIVQAAQGIGGSPTGDGLQTLAAITQLAAGNLDSDGDGLQLLAALTQAGAGHMHADGAGLQLLAALTQVGAGHMHADGTGLQTLAALLQLGISGDVVVGGGFLLRRRRRSC